MDGKRVFRFILAALCIALAALLISAAVGIWLEGSAVRESGDVLAPVYTREKAAVRLAPVIPLAGATGVLAIIGIAAGIRNERSSLPRSLPLLHFPEENTSLSRRRTLARRIVLAAAIALIAAGILNGSMRDVLIKAIHLCTECVGIG